MMMIPREEIKKKSKRDQNENKTQERRKDDKR